MRFYTCLLLLTVLLVGCIAAEPAPLPTPTTATIEITAPSLPTPTVEPAPEPTIAESDPTALPEPASQTGNLGSLSPAISGDGRYIVFLSAASNLIPIPLQASCDMAGDGVVDDPCLNVYRYDRETDELTLVTRGRDDTAADGFAAFVSISDDGRYIAFVSNATNLDATQDVLCEQQEQAPCGNVYLYDHESQEITWVTQPVEGDYANDFSLFSHLAANGQAIVYYSVATNLVPNDTNGIGDIFLYDITTKTTRIVSVSSESDLANDTTYSPYISGNGQFVTFSSVADNLVSNDNNQTADVFVHEIATGITTRISVSSDGTEGDNFSEYSTISNDGRYLTFESVATTLDSRDANFICDLDNDGNSAENCRDIFLHDRESGTTTLLSLISSGGQIFSPSFSGVISGDGQSALYTTGGTGMVRGDTNGAYDLFIRDIITSETTVVSVASDGTMGNHNSGFTISSQIFPRDSYDLSDNGRFVVFNSSASNFVANDLNNETCNPDFITGGFAPQCSDVFLHDRETGDTFLISGIRNNP